MLLEKTISELKLIEGILNTLIKNQTITEEEAMKIVEEAKIQNL